MAHFAVHGVGSHFDPSASFLNCELTVNGCRRYCGSSTIVVTSSTWPPPGSGADIEVFRNGGVLAVRNAILAQISGAQVGRGHLQRRWSFPLCGGITLPASAHQAATPCFDELK